MITPKLYDCPFRLSLIKTGSFHHSWPSPAGALWDVKWLDGVAEQWPHLEVPVDYAHSVKIVHSIQDLADESAGIFLSVKPLLHYPIKEFSTRHTVKQINKTLLKHGGLLRDTGKIIDC